RLFLSVYARVRHPFPTRRSSDLFVRTSAMQKVSAPFDIVVTTNSGYPLDLNLYQGVKGMSAGARILKPGGLLILACECREGVPRSEEHTSELQSRVDLVCRLLLE